MFITALLVIHLAQAAPTTVSVATIPASTSHPIPPNFVGFSTENEPQGVQEMLCSGMYNALRNLHQTTAGSHAGPVIRVGGNSADNWCFHSTTSTHPPPVNCSGTFNETTVQRQLAFAKQAQTIDAKFVIDVNFGLTADPAVVAVPHVRALTAAGLWPYIHAVEIGNEMDLYAGHSTAAGKPHHRDQSYSYDQYAAGVSIRARVWLWLLGCLFVHMLANALTDWLV